MSTFLQLVDQVDLALSGFVLDQVKRTHLTADLTNNALTFSVDEPSNISRGLIEVDNELMWVKRVDVAANLVSLAPQGRGYRSTTATTHGNGATVTDNPVFPRSQIRTYINEVIGNFFPDLYQLKSTTFAMQGARSTYQLPADCYGVNSVHWETIGPSKDWAPVERWEFNGKANTTAFPTGRSIDVWSLVVPGRTVQVDYIARPGKLVNDADDFETTTGLRDYCETAVVHGACYRMSAMLGTARLQTRAVETTQRSTFVESGDAAKVSQFFYALYTEALANSRDAFLKEVPSLRHFRSW